MIVKFEGHIQCIVVVRFSVVLIDIILYHKLLFLNGGYCMTAQYFVVKYTCTDIGVYCIGRNFCQEKIVANFATLLCWGNFVSCNFLSCIDDYIEGMVRVCGPLRH